MVFTCCVPHCMNRSDKTSMHRFPGSQRDHKRFYTWLRAVNNKKLYTLEKSKVRGFRVCSLHFSAEQWCSIADAKLAGNAVPDINLSLAESVGTASNNKQGDNDYSDQNKDALIDARVDALIEDEVNSVKSSLNASEALLFEPGDEDQILPTFEEFSMVCRICLERVYPAEFLKISDVKYNISLASLIKEYFKVQITDDAEELPKQICSDCINSLINIHTFRSKFHRNNGILKNLMRLSSTSSNDLDNQDLEQETIKLTEVVEPKNDNSPKVHTYKELLTEVVERKMGSFRCRACPRILPSEEEFITHDRLHKRTKVKEDLRIEITGSWSWIERKRLRMLERGIPCIKPEIECSNCHRLFVSMKYLWNHKKTCTYDMASDGINAVNTISNESNVKIV